ncbi:MAG: recombinase family protein [Rhodoglobus sp.]
MKVIAYRRVSTEDQSRSGLGMDAQRETILSQANARGWEVEWIEDEGVSAKSLDRPGLLAALASLKSGDAQAIVASKLDRLSRSVMDFGHLLELSRKQKWGIVVLDFDLDTTTAAGRMFAGVMMQFAQFERELIGERTRAALSAAQARGVQLGAPVAISPAIETRVIEMWERGYSLARIAQTLTADDTPTVKGGAWAASTISRIIKRRAS